MTGERGLFKVQQIGALQEDAAEQTIDLLDVATGGVPVTITTGDKQIEPGHVSRGVVVVRSNGEVGQTLIWGEQGPAVSLGRQPCRLVPGSYYVLPDTMNTRSGPMYVKFIAMLQNGSDASQSGVPVLTVAENAPDAALAIPDVAAAQQAIAAFVAPPGAGN